MEHDLFDSLPSEMMMRIFSRLSLRSVGISKCVCKSWRELLESDEFVKSHFAKSVPVLIKSDWSNVFEFEDDFESSSSLDRRDNPLTKFVFPHKTIIEGSANGLVLVAKCEEDEGIYVCNPVTREFIGIDCPQPYDQVFFYGFGMSKMGGEYKVVRFHQSFREIRPLECRVYTIGTGLWRSVEVGVSLEYRSHTSAATVDGNLHWVVLDSVNLYPRVCCFDLETECVTTFDVPPPLREIFEEDIKEFSELSALSGCLCLSHFCDDVIVIWLMKEYGKSWSKEHVFRPNPYYRSDVDTTTVYPLKVYENGDMLMLWDEEFLLYYSNKTKTTRKLGVFDGFVNSVLITPSFFSLKGFEIENVISI